MVKANEENVVKISEPEKTAGTKNGIRGIVYLVILGLAGYGLWQNPQLVDKARDFLENSVAEKPVSQPQSPVSLPQNDELQQIREEIFALRSQLSQLQNKPVDTSALDEKFANLEQTNLGIMNSKADASVVLGLISRLDKLEQNLDLISKVTDSSALSLTALMMVKDCADRGDNFAYEAAVLQQLTDGNSNVKEPVDVIVRVSQDGLKSNAYLMKSFDKIYQNISKINREQYEKDWKDRVNNKINEFIKIRKIDENSEEYKTEQSLERVKELVDAGNIKQALLNLQNINNKALLDNEELKNWMKDAAAKTDFSEAVARISVYYISAMKVNFLKKETKYD